VTVEKLLEDHQFTQVEATVGICYWDGKAPFCMSTACPPGYDRIRQSNGWKNADEGFGGRCWNPLGGGKIFCCRASIGDTSWAGSWQDAMSGEVYHCSYSTNGGRCGHMDCNLGISRFHIDIDGEGDKCNEITMPDVSLRKDRDGKVYHAWAGSKRGVWAAGVIQFPWSRHKGEMDRLYKIH